MTSKKILLGMLALVLTFGMTVVGCGGDDDDDDSGSGGTFTLTDIPSDYNGNYAMYSSTDLPQLAGFQSIDFNTRVITLVRISNGSVSLPMWVAGNGGYTRFSGNRTTTDESYVVIASTATITPTNAESVAVASITLPSITFSNGNATKSWNDQIE